MYRCVDGGEWCFKRIITYDCRCNHCHGNVDFFQFPKICIIGCLSTSVRVTQFSSRPLQIRVGNSLFDQSVSLVLKVSSIHCMHCIESLELYLSYVKVLQSFLCCYFFTSRLYHLLFSSRIGCGDILSLSWWYLSLQGFWYLSTKNLKTFWLGEYNNML